MFDNQGHAFVCYIAFDKLGTFNYWAHGATRNGIFVRRSLDGGKTWEANHIPVAEQPSTAGIPFEDKPYIVADNSEEQVCRQSLHRVDAMEIDRFADGVFAFNGRR